jgi:hypothetical protein
MNFGMRSKGINPLLRIIHREDAFEDLELLCLINGRYHLR